MCVCDYVSCTLTLLPGRFNPLEAVVLQCCWGVWENPSGSMVADPITYSGQINKTVLRERLKWKNHLLTGSPSQRPISSHSLPTAHTSRPRGKTRKPFDKSWIVTVAQVLWRFLKFIMGITHKITQCNIFKCVMNASQNPIQILGYQISLNKSPTLSSSSFEDLRGPVCRAGFTTPCRHLSTQKRRLLMARWRERVTRAGRWFHNDFIW